MPPMHLTCGFETEATLYERICDVSVNVKRLSSSVAQRTYSHFRQGVDADEYNQLAEAAVFLAFIECGGDQDHALAFDWVGRRAELIQKATFHLRRDLREKGSDFYESDHRSTFRRDGATLDQYRWDIWDADVEETRTHRELVQDRLEGLLPALRDVLSARELYVFTERVLHARSQPDLAAELQTTVPAVANIALRARKKAAVALGQRWERLFEDAVNAA